MGEKVACTHWMVSPYRHDPGESCLSGALRCCWWSVGQAFHRENGMHARGSWTYGVGFVVGKAPGLPKVLILQSRW